MPRIRHIVIFDDWKSFIHAIIGFITIVLPTGWAGGLLASFFTLYEILESRDKAEFLGDMIEFMCGLHAAAIVWLCLKPFG